MILAGALAAATAATLLLLSFAPPAPASAIARHPLSRRLRTWRRRNVAPAAVVPILQGTHAGLRSGLPLVAAVRAALGPHGEVARAPFADLVNALELNAAVDEAMGAVRQRYTDRRVITALDAIALVARDDLPSSRAAALIAGVADRLSFEVDLRAEVDARASGVRAQIVILALVVPCFALYLLATMPGLAATLTSPLGSHLLVPVAALLEIAGIVLSRRVVGGLEL